MRTSPRIGASLAAIIHLGSCTVALSESGIVETLENEGRFTTLLAALRQTGLDVALSGAGPFTLFAPADGAFAALLATLGTTAEELLARADLGDILEAHVASSTLLSADLAGNGTIIQTLEGARMMGRTVDGVAMVGTASVVLADLICSNGVVHEINSVLLPPSRLRLAGGPSWSEGLWRPQVDGVMGGRSTGEIRFDDGAMVFSGVININGGGFSQAHRDFGNPIDLSAYVGILVELDAQPYMAGVAPLGLHFCLHDESRYTYAAAIAVPLAETSAERVKLFIPMSAIDRASQWGSTCSACSLDLRRVTRMQLSVLFQAGPFTVKLREVSAVRRDLDVPFVPAPVVQLQSAGMADLIRAAIRSGATLYDKGYRELCIAVYTSVVRTILVASGMSDHAGVACAGLVRAAQGESTSKAERAWALRRAMDALLADATGVPRNANSQYPASVQGAWLPSAAGAAGAEANSCAALQYIDATGYAGGSYAGASSTITESGDADGCTVPSGSTALADFLGPFREMGISYHNDFGLITASSPEDCARRCRCQPNCRSFDFGARGRVSGECWMSLADRASAGDAYTRWPLYDYYEMKADGVASMADDPLLGGTDDEAPSVASNPLLFGLIGAGVVILILAGLLLVMILRLRKRSQSFVPSNATVVRGSAGGGISQDVVVGKPVVVQVPEDSLQGKTAREALPAEVALGA